MNMIETFFSYQNDEWIFEYNISQTEGSLILKWVWWAIEFQQYDSASTDQKTLHKISFKLLK